MDFIDDPARKSLIAQTFLRDHLSGDRRSNQSPEILAETHPEDFAILDGGDFPHFKDYEEWKQANPEEWAAEQEASDSPSRPSSRSGSRCSTRPLLGADLRRSLTGQNKNCFSGVTDFPEEAGRELGIVEALEQVVTRREALAIRKNLCWREKR